MENKKGSGPAMIECSGKPLPPRDWPEGGEGLGYASHWGPAF